MIDSAWKEWYRAQHNDRCLASGEAFEQYVSQILSRLHRDYLNPKPMGRLGDGGCDGIADDGSIIYACYGQRARTDVERKTMVKLEADFQRALECWEGFSTWRFVTNADLGMRTISRIMELRFQHGPESTRPINIEIWDADRLWHEAFSKLDNQQKDEVIPGVPHAQNVEFADLIALVDALETSGQQEPDQIQQIRPVSATKMDFNDLHEKTRIEFNEGRLLSDRIQQWFACHPRPDLRDQKAQSFRDIYEKARMTTKDNLEIVRYIYGAIGGSDFDLNTKRANAVYAITVYFFDSCDIFEEPPATITESEGPDAPTH